MIKKLNYLSGSIGRLGLPQSVRNVAIMVNSCASTINQLIDKVENWNQRIESCVDSLIM